MPTAETALDLATRFLDENERMTAEIKTTSELLRTLSDKNDALVMENTMLLDFLRLLTGDVDVIDDPKTNLGIIALWVSCTLYLKDHPDDYYSLKDKAEIEAGWRKTALGHE